MSCPWRRWAETVRTPPICSMPAMVMPCLIYIAEGDDPDFSGTQEYMQQMPNATFLGLRDHNHVNANTNLDVIVPNMRDFLAKVQ